MAAAVQHFLALHRDTKSLFAAFCWFHHGEDIRVRANSTSPRVGRSSLQSMAQQMLVSSFRL